MAIEQSRTQVVQLLGDIMNNPSELMHQSTEELTSLHANPDSTVELCLMLGNVGKLPAMRKCSGHILKNRLAQAGMWKKMTFSQQQETQKALFSALKSMSVSDDESLQMTIVRCVGLVMEHVMDATDETSEWNNRIMNHINDLCVCPDKIAQQLGSICFKLLMKGAPNVFEKYLLRAKSIFMNALQKAKENGDLGSQATENLLAGWSMAIPLFRSHISDQDELAATLPLIMELTHAFAYLPNPKRSYRGFDVLVKLNKHLPELVWPQLHVVLNKLMGLAGDLHLSDEIRVQAIISLRNCVRHKRRHIIRLKMMDKLLMTLFHLMAVKPALDADGEELYLVDSNESQSPLSEAAQTVLFIAAQSDTNRVAQRALRLMLPKLDQQKSALQRVAAYLFLALMAKGFTDLLADDPLHSFVAAVERGVHDVDSMVRRSAHFALAILAENLQPEITVLAPQILRLFCEFLDQMTPAQRLTDHETESQTRMFCTLEIYCESLRREALQPHLGELMRRLMYTADPNHNSISLRQLALSAIASLAKMTTDMFKPHFDEVLAVALPLARHTPNDDQTVLRTQAVQVINMLSHVDTEKFKYRSPELMGCFLDLLHNENGVQVFTFELLGALAKHVPNMILHHVEPIMGGLFLAIKDGPNDGKATDEERDADDLEVETDADASICAEEDSIGDGHGDQTENDGNSRSGTSSDSLSTTVAADEALLCIKELAEHVPDALIPCLTDTERYVADCSDARNELTRRAAYEAMSQLAALHFYKDDVEETKRQWQELMPDLVDFVETAKETANVIGAMNCITLFLKMLKSDALEGEGFSDMIISVVRRTLRRKLSCQFNIGQDTKMSVLQQWSQALYAEMQVMEAVGDLLPAFGQSMSKRQFATHFQSISNRFLKSLRQCKPSGQVTAHLFFLYNLVFRCMEPLGVMAEQYYDVLCYSAVDCMMDGKPQSRKFAIDVLHWLLSHVHDTESADVIVKATSSVFIEALDACTLLSSAERELVCAVVARMMLNVDTITNENTLALLYANLPLRSEFGAYLHIVQAMRRLYEKYPQLLEPHLRETVQLLLESLEKQQLPDENTQDRAIRLLTQIRRDRKPLYDEISQQFPAAMVKMALN
ncbi:hypothetical protein AWZ03_014085 [Drosophila navojoa]|uniref:Importin N-terminal domain-containing protein n=1 Tax=Drosophila navojoa TaxID=7232 RepID=A0A484AVA3_DRONA|nr:uncharacterized protein LOC115565125 [Drosophila navojoa]TDG39495.1 hypothetical protein AWZ03_014085 [Drosophila navojoa]